MLNEFLYNLELGKLETITKSAQLIAQMRNFTHAYVQIPNTRKLTRPILRDKSNKDLVLKGLKHNSLEIQITTVYRYALYLATRDRYFELQLNIDKLPQYVLWNVPYIDIDKTIQYLRNTHDRKKSC